MELIIKYRSAIKRKKQHKNVKSPQLITISVTIFAKVTLVRNDIRRKEKLLNPRDIFTRICSIKEDINVTSTTNSTNIKIHLLHSAHKLISQNCEAHTPCSNSGCRCRSMSGSSSFYCAIYLINIALFRSPKCVPEDREVSFTLYKKGIVI